MRSPTAARPPSFKIGSNVGHLAISGFGTDPTGIFDLLNRVGGYTSASQAFAALRSDHSGGCQSHRHCARGPLALPEPAQRDAYGLATAQISEDRNFIPPPTPDGRSLG